MMTDIKHQVLADVLLSDYVMSLEANHLFYIDQQWDRSEVFDNYIILYKIAVVILALLNAESKNQNFLSVRIFFEKSVFTDGNIQKLYFYQQVKSAMNKLSELIVPNNFKSDKLHDQNNCMPWTIACLREVGILKEDQPIKHSISSVAGMGWAIAWLRDVGVTELNPVILHRFSLLWIDTYITIVNYMKELNPVGGE